jgi:hypothetical protein
MATAKSNPAHVYDRTLPARYLSWVDHKGTKQKRILPSNCLMLTREQIANGIIDGDIVFNREERAALLLKIFLK